MSEKSNVGIYIDYDNIYVTLEQYYETANRGDLKTIIVEKIREHLKGSKILTIKAFGDFSKITAVLNTLQKNQVELRHVYSSNQRKNASDIVLAINVMKGLYAQSTVDKYVIVSSDSDMLPIINEIIYFNKEVFVIYSEFGSKEGYSEYLSEDSYITIEKLLTLTPYKPIEESGVKASLNDYLENINNEIKRIYEKFNNKGTASKKDINETLFKDKKLNLVRNDVSLIIDYLLRKSYLIETPIKESPGRNKLLLNKTKIESEGITLKQKIIEESDYK